MIGVEGDAVLIQWVFMIFNYLKDHLHFKDMKLPALMDVEGEEYWMIVADIRLLKDIIN